MRKTILAGTAAIALFVLHSGPSLAMAATPETSARPSWQSTPPPLDEENPQAALNQANKRFQKAEEDFSAAEKREANAALNQASKSIPAPSAANPESPSVQQPAQTQDPREQALQGSPETGYAGTWKEPGTGDIITSVIAPTAPSTSSQYQNYPIIVEPQVSGTNWSGSGNGWSDESNGWNSSWPQWPGYPGNNGYPVYPPSSSSSSPYPGPGHWRPYPQPPMHPPFNPQPPFPPGYRPLRPMHPGSGGVAGTPGVMPNPEFPSNPVMPPSGQNPFPPNSGPGPQQPPWGGNGPATPSIPGYNPPAIIPGYNPPAVIPGYTPAPPPSGGANFPVSPANPGLQPSGPMINGPAPGFHQLPMIPGGQSFGGHGGVIGRSGRN